MGGRATDRPPSRKVEVRVVKIGVALAGYALYLAYPASINKVAEDRQTQGGRRTIWPDCTMGARCTFALVVKAFYDEHALLCAECEDSVSPPPPPRHTIDTPSTHTKTWHNKQARTLNCR